MGWEYKEEEVTVTKPLVEIFGIPVRAASLLKKQKSQWMTLM